MLNPHFSPAFYCGCTEERVYCVALLRAPRRTVKYACGDLGRAHCIHAALHSLATKPGEKCGLMLLQIPKRSGFGRELISDGLSEELIEIDDLRQIIEDNKSHQKDEEDKARLHDLFF